MKKKMMELFPKFKLCGIQKSNECRYYCRILYKTCHCSALEPVVSQGIALQLQQSTHSSTARPDWSSVYNDGCTTNI